MYAFTDPLRQAWKNLLFLANKSLDSGKTWSIDFGHDPEDFNNDRVIMGHTCGYPFIHYFSQSHRPVCIPDFAADGCLDGNYCSWLVCRADDPRREVSQFAGSRAAINNWDSNSGMNVFRATISELAESGRFFESVWVSGGHLNSVLDVIDNKADLAAIDAVSWHLMVREGLVGATRVRLLGQTPSSPGLPFVVPVDSPWQADQVTGAMNAALEQLDPLSRDTLFLKSFLPASPTQYERISEIEQGAISAGYPRLQ